MGIGRCTASVQRARGASSNPFQQRGATDIQIAARGGEARSHLLNAASGAPQRAGRSDRSARRGAQAAALSMWLLASLLSEGWRPVSPGKSPVFSPLSDTDRAVFLSSVNHPPLGMQMAAVNLDN